MKQSVIYERKRIIIDREEPIRKGICNICGKSRAKGEIKITALHHYKYAYTRKTIRKHPELALENTIETCFGCHPILDGLRQLLLSSPRGSLRDIYRIREAIKLLPKDQQEHFRRVCEKNGT